MFIETQETPNPNTLKFLLGQPILESGIAEFKKEEPEDAGKSPLAFALFELEDVSSVFLAHDFLSISKMDNASWESLRVEVLEVLMEFFLSNTPVLNEPITKEKTNGLQNEIVKQINALLDQAVRPALANDGGDVTFHDFDEETGIVYLEMVGACAGCPSATMTLKMGIERALKHHIPEVSEVRPVGV